MKRFQNLKKVKKRNSSNFYTVSYKKRMRVIAAVSNIKCTKKKNHDFQFNLLEF